MRTTINLDDDVFRAYKQRAAESGETFARVVEDALRADLHEPTQAREPVEMITFTPDVPGGLVDISDPDAVKRLLYDDE